MKLRLRKKKEVSTIKSVLPECLNCGKPLAADDNFCSYCGQKNVEKLSFSSFLGQLISGFFNYDSRFWTTIVPLIFKPGKVSKDFIDGKRKRYVNPFQMYLHVSILFFLIFGWTSNFDEINFDPNINENDVAVIDSLLQQGVANLDEKEKVLVDSLLVENKMIRDSVKNEIIKKTSGGFNFSKMIVDTIYNIDRKNHQFDSISRSDKIEDFYSFLVNNPGKHQTETSLKKLGYPVNFWNSFYFEQATRIKKNVDLIENQNFAPLINKSISYFSIGLFIFLPLFALSLKLFYYRKHMNYMEHLVFVFHTQTVFFLLLLISTLVGLVSNYENFWIFMLLFLIYLFLALRKFYQQGVIKTFIKFVLLNWVYSTLAAFAVMIISVLAFMLD
ncbi:DUF3667 domain-containing protein [Urechidicola vernalis]|uniref:DUF3667 domain-containing protein n=1 Tax=Urechidicola vernalis TaxID=3075600 RepID=A0ABU2Y794_9FLAO|nr:DUF3667 domain-containing protein [Urechidicola sp. P050]MDT0554073.1 DUF3667 domain-containing protein [Urechidicola sp. P050]